MSKKHETLADITPPKGNESASDQQLMRRAWNANVSSQRDVIEQLKRTRYTLRWCVAIVVFICLFLAWRVGLMEEKSDIVLRTALIAGDRLTQIEQQQRVVLNAVNEVVAVGQLEEEAEDMVEQIVIEQAAESKRDTTATAEEFAVVKQRVREKREQAKAAVIRAKIQLAPPDDRDASALVDELEAIPQ